MSRIRRITINSLILYFRLFVTAIVGILFSRLILRALGESDYGLFNVVSGFVALLNVANLFLIAATYRFISYELGRDRAERLNLVFNTSFFLHLCFALIVLFLAETIGQYYIRHYLNVAENRQADALFLFHLSILTTLISIAVVPFQAMMTAYEEFGALSFFEIAMMLSRLLALVFLFDYPGDRLRFYATLYCGISIFFLLGYAVWCFIKHRQQVQITFRFDWSVLKKILNFAGWSWIGSLAFLGRAQGAALLINFFFGTIVNAAFAIAGQINQVLQMFAQSIGQAVIPQIIQSYSSGDLHRSMRLVCYANKYSVFFMFLPAALLFLEMDYILKIWLGDVPEYAPVFCRWMIVIALIDCVATSGITAFIQAHGDIKLFQIGLAFSMLLSLPISWLFLYYGGSARIVLIVQAMMSFVGLIVRIVLLKYKYQFNLKLLVRISFGKIIFLPSVLIAPIATRCAMESDTLRILSISIAYFLSYLVVCYFSLDDLEKNILKQKIETLKIKRWK